MFMRFPGGLSKALTLSYDDGVEQDARLIGILNRYGIKATFNLNSGMFAPEGTVYPKGQVHRRMTLSQVKTTYDASFHEVAVHCLTHASLPELPAAQVVWEVMRDRENLEREFGMLIRGMAYPFGTYSEMVVQALQSCGIAYARTTKATRAFSLPEDFLRLHPTCHHKDPQLPALCDQFLGSTSLYGCKLFYLWGHSYEFESDSNWSVIESFAEKMGGHPDIWYATNIGIVNYVNAFRSLISSADGQMLHNPTVSRLWFEHNGKIFQIDAGETMDIKGKEKT